MPQPSQFLHNFHASEWGRPETEDNRSLSSKQDYTFLIDCSLILAQVAVYLLIIGVMTCKALIKSPDTQDYRYSYHHYTPSQTHRYTDTAITTTHPHRHTGIQIQLSPLHTLTYTAPHTTAIPRKNIICGSQTINPYREFILRNHVMLFTTDSMFHACNVLPKNLDDVTIWV